MTLKTNRPECFPSKGFIRNNSLKNAAKKYQILVTLFGNPVIKISFVSVREHKACVLTSVTTIWLYCHIKGHGKSRTVFTSNARTSDSERLTLNRAYADIQSPSDRKNAAGMPFSRHRGQGSHLGERDGVEWEQEHLKRQNLITITSNFYNLQWNFYKDAAQKKSAVFLQALVDMKWTKIL